MTSENPKPCSYCGGHGIVHRIAWHGDVDEDWCDCPAAEAYKFELDTREPATTF